MAGRRRSAALLWVALLLAACRTSGSTAQQPATASPPTTSATTTQPAPATTSTTLPAGILQRPITVPGPAVLLRYDEGMAPEGLSIVEATIPVAYEALGEAGPLVVHVYASADNFVASHDPRLQDRARADVEGGLVATGGAGAIRIYGPRFLDRDTADRRLAVIHEYFHAVQARLSGGRSTTAPLWLREGTARYVERGVARDRGYIDYGRRRSTDVRSSRGLEALVAYEEPGGATFRGDSGGAYIVGFLASEYLESLKGRDAVQREFWAGLRSGTDWKIAFAAVFDVSVERFYADFEAYRQTL